MTPAPSAVFRSLAGKPVFRVGDQRYCWEDVILAARRWGDWKELVADVREGVACIRHMRATGKRPTDADEEAAATHFRTFRKLYTAADTETWLKERKLSADDWMKFIRRALLRERWSADLPELVARYPARKDQVRRGLRIVGTCSGRLMRFAWKLAGRAAVYASVPCDATPASLGDLDAAGAALLGISAEASQAVLARLGQLEESYRRLASQLVTLSAVHTGIAARYSDWMRVEYCSAIFPSAEAASEAVMCVREDGEALADVVARCQVKAVQRRVFLEQLHPTLRGLLLSAKQGELLGPLPAEGGFKLCAVLDKRPPTPREPKVRQRAEELLTATAASLEASQRVQWQCEL